MTTQLTLPLRTLLFNRVWLLHLAFILLAGRAWTQEYTVTNLGTFGGLTSSSNGVNDSGQVVGTSDLPSGQNDPFLYSGGKMTDVWPGTNFGGTTVAINNLGHFVVVLGTDGSGDTVSYLVQGTTRWSIGAGTAIAMNNNDAVLGRRTLYIPIVNQGLWVYSNHQLNLDPGYPLSELGAVVMFPFSINDSGLIGGLCSPNGFAPWDGCAVGPGKALGLSMLGPEQWGGVGLNNNNQGCGIDSNNNLQIWNTTTGQLIGNSNTNVGLSGCAGIDEYGTAVGLTTIYDLMNGPRNLNSLIPLVAGRGYSMSVQTITGIALDTGYISANCSFTSPSGTLIHACLLTPQWPAIVKDSINHLAASTPGCTQCTTVLKPEANSLPVDLATATPAQKSSAVATLNTMQSQLGPLNASHQISQAALVLLSHDIEMAAEAYLEQ